METTMHTYKLAAVAILSCLTIGAVSLWSVAQTAGDTRTKLDLTPQQNAAVRAEMRILLASVSEIVSALDNNDLKGVEEAARKSGMSMAVQVEVSLKKKLPNGFKKLGKSVHVGFDDIADAAGAADADNPKIMSLLASRLQRCVACHDTYVLE